MPASLTPLRHPVKQVGSLLPFDNDSENGDDVPSDESWYQLAGENRARIRNLEAEINRVRERQHELANEVAIVKYLAEQVRNLTSEVRKLSEATQQAVKRPAAQVVAQYVAIIVAIVAIVLSLQAR